MQHIQNRDKRNDKKESGYVIALNIYLMMMKFKPGARKVIDEVGKVPTELVHCHFSSGNHEFS